MLTYSMAAIEREAMVFNHMLLQREPSGFFETCTLPVDANVAAELVQYPAKLASILSEAIKI